MNCNIHLDVTLHIYFIVHELRVDESHDYVILIYLERTLVNITRAK